MSKKVSALGARMKVYEYASRLYLMRRNPVIIRVDGKAFHTFTRGFKEPFDDVFRKSMKQTMQYLCENIQTCVMGYTQSDEITLVLCDYSNLTTEAWFDNNVQKMCSISASMATMAFNNFFLKNAVALMDDKITDSPYWSKGTNSIKQGIFDSRVFSVPKEEVNNCLLWRQQDATRNSIQSVAQANFSQKQIHGLNTDQLQEKLWSEKGINWNDYSIEYKRGCCCVKKPTEVETPNGVVVRNKWVIDDNIPIFSKDTDYVNSRITFD